MLIRLLGIFDIFAALTFVGFHFGMFSHVLPLYILVYIGLKFLIFPKDFASFVEISCAIILILLMLDIRTRLTWVAVIFFLQKGILSLK